MLNVEDHVQLQYYHILWIFTKHNHIWYHKMDKPNMNKRKTFSPSSIEQVEQDTYSRLCGTDNRYEVSEEWKGREPDLWEQLHSEFPAPSNIQAEVDVLKFYQNYRGCPDWCVTMDCICFNCTQMQDAYTSIPYAHQLMKESILANMPSYAWT